MLSHSPKSVGDASNTGAVSVPGDTQRGIYTALWKVMDYPSACQFVFKSRVVMQLTRSPIVKVNVGTCSSMFEPFLLLEMSLSVSMALLMSFIYDEGMIETVTRDHPDQRPEDQTRQYRSTNWNFPTIRKSTNDIKAVACTYSRES